MKITRSGSNLGPHPRLCDWEEKEVLLTLARFFIHVYFHNHFRLGYLTGAGSDYAAFVHYLGITSVDMSYTYDGVWK